MDTKDIPLRPISDWQPITDKHDLAVLGKLGEEMCELGEQACKAGKAIFRSIIQGIDGKEPTTLKENKQWLEEEIADCMALQILAVHRLGLDQTAILERRDRKIGYKEPWFDSLAGL